MKDETIFLLLFAILFLWLFFSSYTKLKANAQIISNQKEMILKINSLYRNQEAPLRGILD